MKTYIKLPYDIHGIIIKYLDKDDLLELRSVCEDTRKNVFKYGKFLFTVYNLEELQQIRENNKKDIVFKKITFQLDNISENNHRRYYPYIPYYHNEYCHYNSIPQICEELKVNDSLQGLSVWKQNIGIQGGKTIGELLKVNNSLQRLNISDNQLNDECAKVIGDALKVNKSLQVLYISDNHIGSEGTKSISEALKVNKKLKKLDIKNNGIGTMGIKALCEALKVNKYLQELYIWEITIDEKCGKLICEALQMNHSLKVLDIGFNNKISNNISQEDKEIIRNICKQKEGFKLYL